MEALRKRTIYDALLEVEGLEALRQAGAATPTVFEATSNYLVLEKVSATPDWPRLGQTLAGVHRTTHPTFGWHRDNVIGDRPQHNRAAESWSDFFVERRILPWLSPLPTDVAHRLETACRTTLPELLDHDAIPSLVHGDLWSGNVVDGFWLIDPAVSYSDREVELAFASLFGGMPDTFFLAYNEAWPMDDGWQYRRPALQLYHSLIHVEIFGNGYLPMVISRLDQIGA